MYNRLMWSLLTPCTQIAAIFEFTGAMVLGRVSTSTIAGGIADVKTFQREPEVFAYGMVCAMTVAGIWQIVASYFEFNVSSTHSIIGCILGFALVYGGSDAVLWQVEDKKSFPPVKVSTQLSCQISMSGGWLGFELWHVT